MFERKTVFILGAGASWHYNYPTGDDLVQCVLDYTGKLIRCYEWEERNSKNNRKHPISRISSICEIMNDEMVSHSTVLKFLQNFHDRLKFVNPPVIDYFFQSNDDLREIGKLMIAWVILGREKSYNEYGNQNRTRIGQNLNEHKDDWYRYILYKMLIACNDYSDVFSNQVDFITFNYNVSLDHYLYKGLKQIAFMKPDSVSDNEIKEELENRIHHVYGFVRETDPFSDVPPALMRSRNQNVSEHADIVDAAYKASQSIDTIAGQKREIADCELKKIEEAQDIYVLGFGFDKLNCESLNARDYFGYGVSRTLAVKSDYRRFFFTNFCDHNSVNKKVSNLIGLPDASKFLASSNGTPFYRDYRPRGEGAGSAGLHYEKSSKNVYEALSQDFDFI